MNILILPIGPPGSGKTYLRNQLQDYCLKKNLKFLYSNRDENYKIVRKNNSLKQTRRILYDKLMDFYQMANSGYYDIIYNDSVNTSYEIRQKFIDSIRPKKTIFINFRISISNIQFLLNRTKERKQHPTFPDCEIKQGNIIRKVLPKIEYENLNDYVLEWDLLNDSDLLGKLKKYF
jgi:thymidylate kinase